MSIIKNTSFAILFYVLMTACSEDSEETAPVPSASIQAINHSTYGAILADAAGRTLYFFSNDTEGGSTCDGNCSSLWPAFNPASLSTGPGLDNADFNQISRTDGGKQLAYKGFPLYYYSGDTNPGDVNGDNVNGVWFVAKPNYSLFYLKGQLVGHDDKPYIPNYSLEPYSEGFEPVFYLSDSNGRTLYTFRNDKKDQNTFTTNPNNNPAIWPLFYAPLSSLNLPSALDRDDFGAIQVNGAMQTTYKGWPLYYFGGTPTTPGDTESGHTRGVSFPSPGIWPIANTSTGTAPE